MQALEAALNLSTEVSRKEMKRGWVCTGLKKCSFKLFVSLQDPGLKK